MKRHDRMHMARQEMDARTTNDTGYVKQTRVDRERNKLRLRKGAPSGVGSPGYWVSHECNGKPINRIEQRK